MVVICTDPSLTIWHEHTVLIPRQMSVGQLPRSSGKCPPRMKLHRAYRSLVGITTAPWRGVPIDRVCENTGVNCRMNRLGA
jgi:hypothetical protein